ncbi:hypothetical protein B0T26DRAFT_734491 [Lasiosphaeria miniovina]|uniref:JmjC domain-containing protein n=1 Tax=Lasiosphaeria miniovina TaxID=1954250 RepID=A0AA40DFQ2_9PEZI|nr:uncharacterized protein B0T26DRAFT_734491 [Lasiosphaeria miniovina]KAK0701749.1 hypothetical protein B0T26DRAFT_734491 [Lasiosphaeria miniovina]
MNGDDIIKSLYPLDGKYEDEDDKAQLEGLPPEVRKLKLAQRLDRVQKLRSHLVVTPSVCPIQGRNPGPVESLGPSPAAELTELREIVNEMASQIELLMPRRRLQAICSTNESSEEPSESQLVATLEGFNIALRKIQDHMSKLEHQIFNPHKTSDIASPPAVDIDEGELLESSGSSAKDGALVITAPDSPLTDLADIELDLELDGDLPTVPVFSCCYDDLRSLNKNKFNQICQDFKARKHGLAKLQFDDLPPCLSDLGPISQPNPQNYSLFHSYKRTGDFITVTSQNPRQQITFPKLPYLEDKRTWSSKELLDVVQTILEHTPSGTICYIVGTPLFSDIEMHPGDKLKRRGGGKIPGVHSPYIYWNISGGPTITVMHKEDGDACSFNVVRSGAGKVVIVIAPNDSKRFEQRMRDHFDNTTPCSQFIRHLSCAPFLTKLQEWNILYHLSHIGPNQGFLTLPGTYHMVVNLGNNFATAINFEDNTSQDLPLRYTFCTAKCPGTNHITEATWKLSKRPVSRDKNAKPKRKKPKECPVDAEPEQMEPDQTFLRIPLLNPKHQPPRYIINIIQGIFSKASIEQFQSVINFRRAPDNSFRFDDEIDATIRLAKRIKLTEENTLFGKFARRFFQSRLARDLDSTKRGFERVDSATRQKFQNALEFSTSKMDFYLSHGRKWNRICGPYDGLLCYLFLTPHNPFNILPEDYHNIAEHDIKVLHGLLGIPLTRDLCAAGIAFQGSLEDMVFYLQPYQPIVKNVYNPAKYPDWPRPRMWPENWSWPTNPLDAIGCDICKKTTCNCLNQNHHQYKPRIKRYPGKGLGLQAVAGSHGQIAYTQGATIGYLFGEMVPAGTYENTWAFNFVRSDVDDEQPICQLYCGPESNSFRLLNHDCSPLARFVERKISGQFVMSVEAAKDIYDGMEITASYGKGFFRENCLCETCRSRRVLTS